MAKGDWKVIHCTVDEAQTKLAEVPRRLHLGDVRARPQP